MIQSRNIKGNWNSLLTQAKRQASTLSISKRKRQQSRSSLLEQRKEAKVTNSDSVSHTQGWVLQVQPEFQPFLNLLLCWFKKKSTISPDAVYSILFISYYNFIGAWGQSIHGGEGKRHVHNNLIKHWEKQRSGTDSGNYHFLASYLANQSEISSSN